MKRQLGSQVLAELTLCSERALDNAECLESMLRRAAQEAGAQLISVHVHRFDPHGLSGVAILAESHLAIHTWPELGYAAVDSFTCGDQVDPMVAVRVIEKDVAARGITTMELSRGVQPSIARASSPQVQPQH